MVANAQPGLKWCSKTKLKDTPAKAFVPLLRSAVAAHPERCDLLGDLATALRDDQRWSEIVDLLAPLEGTKIWSPQLACELGMAAAACNDLARALTALAFAAAGRAPRATAQMSYVLDRLERHAEAVDMAKLALQEDPGDSGALEILVKRLLHRGQADDLAALCDDLRARGGASATLLAVQAVALAANGQLDELNRLFDPPRWCAQIKFDHGLIDHQRLTASILSHPALASSTEYKATRGCNSRLEHLADRPEPAIQEIIALMRHEIDAYVLARHHLSHPVMAQQPAEALLQGWALVMADDGHELMHIHPKSWLTAVYYVQTPEAPDQGSTPPGSIVFGPWPPDQEDRFSVFPRWHLTPQAGTLLIFPSFMGHRTIPTGVTEPRICVVLDVMPCAASR